MQTQAGSSRATEEETPYYLAAVAGLVVCLAWLGAWSFTGHLPAVYSRDFYASAAQILPVLLLAFGIERKFFARADEAWLSATAAAAYAFVILGSGAGLVLALAALVRPGSPSKPIGAIATFGVAQGLACSLTLIVAYSASNLGVFDVLRRRSGHPTRFAVSGASRSLAAGAGSIVFGTLTGAYSLIVSLQLDEPVSPRVGLFTGVVGLALSGGVFWLGSARRNPRLRRGVGAGLAAVWLALSLFFGWGLSAGPDGYGSFIGVAAVSFVIFGIPFAILLAILARLFIAGVFRRNDTSAQAQAPAPRPARPLPGKGSSKRRRRRGRTRRH